MKHHGVFLTGLHTAAGQEVPVQDGVVVAIRALAVLIDEHLGQPALGRGVRSIDEQALHVVREHPDQRVVLQTEDLVVLSSEGARPDPCKEGVVHTGVLCDLNLQSLPRMCVHQMTWVLLIFRSERVARSRWGCWRPCSR